MIWRIIAFWLASLTLAFADLPRRGAWVETNETRFAYDRMLVAQECDTNNPLVSYTRGLDVSLTLGQAGGIGGLLARTDANGSTYYHSDGNGNITALIDGNENIVARYEYDNFGKQLGQWGSLAAGNRCRFSSKDYISQAHLYYFGRRFYDPNPGRWLNRDPIGESGGVNLYGYVQNAAVNVIDFWGLWDPDGYWVQSNAEGQPVNPSTGKPPGNVTRPDFRSQVHVPLPPQ